MAVQSLPQRNQEPSREQFFFKTLSKNDQELILILEEYFSEKIEPLYGNQSEFIRKIKEGKDRVCEFIFYGQKVCGIVIYKNHTSDEFADFGLKNSLEIKTIFLIDQKAKTAGLFLRYLLSRVAQYAIKINATSLFGTISAKKPEVLRVMRRLGFNAVATFKDKYLKNTDEYLMCHPFPYNLLLDI